MNYKTFTSKLIHQDKKNILLEDIYPEIDHRGIIEGLIIKKIDDKGLIIPACESLVSLYIANENTHGYQPLYHTYSDDKGRFLFPAQNTNNKYMVKVSYMCLQDETSYLPYESKSFKVGRGVTHKLLCYLHPDYKRVLSGSVMNYHTCPQQGIPVELYLTIGPNKIPVIQLGKTSTGSNGDFYFNITADGNYMLKLYV